MRCSALLLALVLAGCQSLAIVRGPNRNVSSIEVEIDYTTSQPPSPQFLNVVKGFMESICDPVVSVSFFVDDDLSGSGQAEWTSGEMQSFAMLHHDNPDRFYVIWANGTQATSPQVGGYSWDKRRLALFPEVYQNNAGGLQQAFTHEWCHCLGLVSKFLKMQEAHKHSYGNHCDQPQCLMQPATWVNWLCQKCLADLTAGEEK